jgi:hypothetical protein
MTQCKQVVYRAQVPPSRCTRVVTRDGYCFQHHPDAVEMRRVRRVRAVRLEQERRAARALEAAESRLRPAMEKALRILQLGHFGAVDAAVEVLQRALRGRGWC